MTTFAIKPVSMNEIPEKKELAIKQTERSVWCGELLDAFMDSPDGIWELYEGLEGRFSTQKEATSYYSSLKSKCRRKKYNGMEIVLRGKRIFLSKVKVNNVN